MRFWATRSVKRCRKYGSAGNASPKFMSDACISQLSMRGYQVVRDERGDPVKVGTLIMTEIHAADCRTRDGKQYADEGRSELVKRKRAVVSTAIDRARGRLCRPGGRGQRTALYGRSLQGQRDRDGRRAGAGAHGRDQFRAGKEESKFMANPTTLFGFRPIQLQSGGPFGVSEYAKPATDTAFAIFMFDLVGKVASAGAPPTGQGNPVPGVQSGAGRLRPAPACGSRPRSISG